MGRKDRRVDVYIATSRDFARPVLNHLRELVHKACPDAEETIKWGFPHFEYKGMLCSMASFKEHCAFGFWKASLMSDPKKIISTMGETAMGHFGRLRSLNDLPSDAVILKYIREAARLNDEGKKLPARPKTAGKTEIDVPVYFLTALRKNKKSLAAFQGFSASHKREYVEWVSEAKNEDTRARRLATSVAWMASGKVRNWKYIKK